MQLEIDALKAAAWPPPASAPLSCSPDGGVTTPGCCEKKQVTATIAYSSPTGGSAGVVAGR